MSAPLVAEELVAHALERVARAGADAADVLLVESDSLETRVRGDGIEHVSQARERTLGIRVLVRRNGGLSSAVTSTSDLQIGAVDQMAEATVALAR